MAGGWGWLQLGASPGGAAAWPAHGGIIGPWGLLSCQGELFGLADEIPSCHGSSVAW